MSIFVVFESPKINGFKFTYLENGSFQNHREREYSIMYSVCPKTSIVKTRQTNLCCHLPAISHSKQAQGVEGVGAVHMPCWIPTSDTRWLHV